MDTGFESVGGQTMIYRCWSTLLLTGLLMSLSAILRRKSAKLIHPPNQNSDTLTDQRKTSSQDPQLKDW